MPVSVVQFADFASPYGGSFVDSLQAIADAARRRDWPCALVLPVGARERDWVRALRYDRVHYMDVGSRFRMARDVSRLLRDVPQPTIIHTHFTGFDLPVVLAATARPQTRLFWHIHGSAAEDLWRTIRGTVKFAIVGRRVAGIFCVAPPIVEHIRKLAPRAHVVLSPNAIDTDRFPLASPARRNDARRSRGIPEDQPVLLHFGWDWEVKGGDVFLGATKALLDGGREVVAVTIRGGSKALALAEELGIGDFVHVYEPSESPADLYAMADVFVSSSRSEGMPYSIAEALCTGIPVVATNIPGQATSYGRLGACRLTTLSPDDIARTISSILDRDPAVARREAAEARDYVCRHMGLQPWGEWMLDSYARALRGEPVLDRVLPAPSSE